jgi:hypothetical protein
MLHSWKLEFVHPHAGKKMYFETERPAFAGRDTDSNEKRKGVNEKVK